MQARLIYSGEIKLSDIEEAILRDLLRKWEIAGFVRGRYMKVTTRTATYEVVGDIHTEFRYVYGYANMYGKIRRAIFPFESIEYIITVATLTKTEKGWTIKVQ